MCFNYSGKFESLKKVFLYVSKIELKKIYFYPISLIKEKLNKINHIEA